MTGATRRGAAIVLALVAWGTASCGDGAGDSAESGPGRAPPATATTADRAPSSPWAPPSAEQVAEAERLGVPVAFENDLGMRFVLVPSGTFHMGSPGDEEGREEDEVLHEVELTRPLYVQTTEVTNGQFRRFRPSHSSGEFEGHSLDQEGQPVVQVSWEDAMAFAAWLGREDPGRTYRLPTEAEWEHACRAGTRSRFSWGESEHEAHRHANVRDRTGGADGPGAPGASAPPLDGHRVAAPVGTYLPNPWGLFDMHGNVWEWCRDRYGEYSRGRAVDPTGPPDGDARVVRGGSWNVMAILARSALRDASLPGLDSRNHGFRLASPLPDRED